MIFCCDWIIIKRQGLVRLSSSQGVISELRVVGDPRAAERHCEDDDDDDSDMVSRLFPCHFYITFRIQAKLQLRANPRQSGLRHIFGQVSHGSENNKARV